MDPRNLTEYREELAELVRKRFGPKKDRNQPVRYTAAFSLTHAVAAVLTESDHVAFLRAALHADRDSHRGNAHQSALSDAFAERFALELRRALDDFDGAEGHQEAWHIMLALHRILAPDLFSPYIRCAADAWENTAALVRRVPVTRA
ncbi:hypothetical protein [Streptomyces misionensis]|uniref:hypothetical protein n=1 Tax=Streptomyces misionensis TaxID=67331 RepID=UPI0033BE41CC